MERFSADTNGAAGLLLHSRRIFSASYRSASASEKLADGVASYNPCPEPPTSCRTADSTRSSSSGSGMGILR